MFWALQWTIPLFCLAVPGSGSAYLSTEVMDPEVDTKGRCGPSNTPLLSVLCDLFTPGDDDGDDDDGDENCHDITERLVMA